MQKQYDKQFGFNHFPYTHGEQLEKARAEYSEAYKAEMQAQHALRESQNESIISEAIASEKMVDDGERSGISNPFSKTSSSTQPRIREGMGGYKNQKQEDFVNKLLAKTPFYATKHTNHLCKGLNWEAQNSTLKDARKRFEMELLANKQKDMEDEKLLKDLESENVKFQSVQALRKEQTKRQFNDILKEQIQMDKMKKTIERQEDQIGQELVHFGPEDTDNRIKTMLENKKNKQKFMETELSKQITNKNQQLVDFKKEQKIVDALTMNYIGEQLNKEKEASKARNSN